MSIADDMMKLSPKQRELLIQLLKEEGLSASQLPIIPQRRDSQLVPLSFAQQRLWFLDQLEPGSATYNTSLALRLLGSLSIDALEQSLHEIVRRHETLRTTIIENDRQPVQHIASEPTMSLQVVDFNQRSSEEREQAARQYLQQEARRPFDLAHGPLLRAHLLRLDEQNHILLLSMHHIVADGWSLDVLLRELSTLYTALVAGQPSPLPDLPIQYADFALWQRQWLQGQVLEQHLAYWKHQLADVPPLLELPTDHPRPAVQSFRGAIYPFSLPASLHHALHSLSQQEGVTLFMTLLAAFQLVLSRTSGQQDLVVGSPIANRTRAEVEPLIGFFVNTLALRSDLAGQPSVRELLGRVRERTLEAYSHQDVPFEQVVEALQPERNLSRTPLFQVMFVLQNTAQVALELAGVRVEPLPVESPLAKFDLTLEMEEEEQGLSGVIEYNRDLFEPETIGRLVQHLQVVLAGMVAEPQRCIWDLPLLTEAEEQQMLGQWNATDTPYPAERCVHQLFERQVARSPEAIALLDEGQCLTYRELNQRANQLAHYLQCSGVGPDVMVGLCMERSLESIIALLGVLKAGGAYVPLDPGYPQERLTYMVADARMPVVLTKRHLAEIFPRTTQVVSLDTDSSIISQQSKENPNSEAMPSNLAYVIYTSGSTGKPKGVMISHQGLANYLSWCCQYYAVATGNGSAVHSSLAFDLTVTGLFAPLMTGRGVVLVPESQGVEELARVLRQGNNFSLVKITPAHLDLLGQYLAADDLAASTKALVIGGEALLGEILTPWRLYAPATRLINEYGPTETVVGCCIYEVPGEGSISGNIPIGHPIANTQIYLLDSHLQPVPIGVPGELYIGGAGLARGYLNRPDLTAERFIANPFSKEPGTRLYKTGDLALYRADGTIEFLGRNDNQVKIRGYRVELGEIEALLKQHPAVQEAVVMAREDIPGDKRLVAYIVADQLSSPTTELRNYLKEKLPDYMVPSVFMVLEALPLTPNGKVDREALPLPDNTRPALEKTFAPPTTSTEERLAEIWGQVLGIDKIGIHDNFFELGGDSILSIQIIDRARREGLHLTLKQLFLHPTVAELAAVTSMRTSIHAEQGIVKGPVPLTPIQHWFFEQNLAEASHWNQAMLLEVQQALDPALLKKAIQQLLIHHDGLRMRFVHQSSGWQQFNAAPDEAVPFTFMDMSTLSEMEQKLSIERSSTELQASLQLAQGPLLRVALFNLGANRPCRLLLVIHHLVVDSVSWQILLEDLQTAYQQLNRNETIQLPPKTTSFKYWAERLQEYAQSAALQRELTYWLAKSRTEVDHLPTDYPVNEHANTEASAHTVSFSLGIEETRALLQEVPKVYHTQINDVLLTALAQTFSIWTGTHPLPVDLEGHGREDIMEDVDLSHTVGWFTVLFPVLLNLDADDGPGEALKSIKEQLRQVPNRGIGYGLLRYISGDAETTERLRALPPAEVSFNYLGQFDSGQSGGALFRIANESTGPSRSLQGNRSHLLDINGFVSGGQMQIQWTYSENIHSRSTIEGLAQTYMQKLRSLLIHCQSPDAGGYTPSDFPLAGLDEQRLSKLSDLMNKIDASEELLP